MTLEDTAKTIQHDIERLEERERRAQRRREFDERRRTLKDARESLQELVRRRVLFARNDIPCDYHGPNVQKTREKLQAVRRRFEDDSDWIVEEDLREDLLDWIRRHRNPLREALDEAWDEHYEKKVTSVPQDLLDALDEIDGFENAVDRIRSLMSSLRTWSREAPSTQAELDGFEEKAEQLQATWEEVESKDLSEDVKIFLRETVSGGARLELVTSHVRQWLKDHNLYEGATVHLGRSS